MEKLSVENLVHPHDSSALGLYSYRTFEINLKAPGDQSRDISHNAQHRVW